jgi:hypothetical protein
LTQRIEVPALEGGEEYIDKNGKKRISKDGKKKKCLIF